LNQDNIIGKVGLAFINEEKLLWQMISFYGRYYYGNDYKNKILNNYDYEAKNKRKNLPSEAKRLRDNREMHFFDYIQILNRFDQWIANDFESESIGADSQDREKAQKFESSFGRKRILPNSAEIGNIVRVPVRVENQIIYKDVSIQEPGSSPLIEIMRRLNKLRPLFTHNHRSARNFQHLSNLENIREGSIKILGAFFDLWEYFRDVIFPPVVVIRRLIKIEPNLTRLDFIPEGGSALAHIHVADNGLPHNTNTLLGKEAYLRFRDEDEEDGIVSNLILYSVDED
jgi:hypothetical protein